MIRNRHTAEHYVWGGVCDGWRLLDHPELRVIEERVPPGAGEVRHRHRRARQVFVVLRGTLEIVVADAPVALAAGDALHVEPGRPHAVRNASTDEAVFLVISAPSTDGDREDLP